jgi:hypothetical protein
MPSIAEVKTGMAGRTDLEAFKPIPELTPEQRAKSNKAAILSMLWLHYAKGWSLDSFKGHVLGKAYEGDPTAALKAACEIYDRDLVMRWMQDQQAAGN